MGGRGDQGDCDDHGDCDGKGMNKTERYVLFIILIKMGSAVGIQSVFITKFWHLHEIKHHHSHSSASLASVHY